MENFLRLSDQIESYIERFGPNFEMFDITFIYIKLYIS